MENGWKGQWKLATRLLLGAILAEQCAMQSGWAQSTPSSGTVAERNGETDEWIPDIIVQARRTSENQQAVPLAVSTVEGDRLRQAAASSVSDIQRLVPSLQIQQGATGQQDFTIRGSFGGFGVDPAVITYIDEVPIDARTLVYGLFDLQSLQQLKGPQGTLFGRNSTGGAVLFFSSRPDPENLGGYATLRYGNLDERRAEGALNIPVTPHLAVRVAGQLERRDGYIRSVTVPSLDFENRHNGALRASVLWEPSSVVENYTQFTHYRVRENRNPQRITALATPCTGPTTPAPTCLYQPPFSTILGTDNILPYFLQQQALSSHRTVADDPHRDDVDRDSITNSLTLKLGGINLRNILYYGDVNVGWNRDYDGTPARVIDSFYDDHIQTTYVETQIYGTLFSDRLNWRIGGVYSKDKGNQSQTTTLFPLPLSLSTPKTTRARTNFVSKALFAQASYDLSDLLRGVTVTAGYRYTWDDRSIKTTVFQGAPVQQCGLQTLPVPTTGPVPYPNTDLTTCTRFLKKSFKDYNINASVDWKITDRILTYVATRRGYKTGSFNNFESNPALASYSPEIVTDIEGGLKADWKVGSMPVRTNIAVFRSKYDNIQTSTVSINPSSGDVTVIVLNTDPLTGLSSKATIKGFEIEVNAAPTRWLQLSGFYSKIRAKYDRFVVPGVNLDISGQNVAGVFPETYGATAQLDIPVNGPVESIGATVSYYYRAKPLTNATTTVDTGHSSSIDARVSARNLFGSGVDVAIFGKNLGDKIACATNTLVAGALTDTCSEPRTYGIELGIRFGGKR
ncbi:TonB-dependent receptor [Sphingobium subterraneum]|uniref:Iron complex outermembrane receptor protein n=1 Tax=Sphingobium subterraneum TaxID=627688 RepID=A0A841J2X2_9SPHN|nr:TonB-dependent receptor plug domain-containing protein [Sphingobium subterraneum]MBB6125313.1 iron complex outermembrane receptor protein [Sphingobium subterraneum]